MSFDILRRANVQRQSEWDRDLWQAVTEKFNKTSTDNNLLTKILRQEGTTFVVKLP